MLRGSFSPKLPFGPEALSVFDLGPVVNLSTGANLIEYGDVNTSEGLKELDKGVPFGTFHDANLPLKIKATLFIRSFEIHEALNAELVAQFRRVCATGAAADYRCRVIATADTRCGTGWRSGPPLPFSGGRYYVYENFGNSECGFLEFQGLLSMLGLSGFVSDAKVDEYVVGKGAEKAIGIRSRAAVNFAAPQVRHAYKRLQREFLAKRIEDEEPLAIKMRSPRDMIEYLGEIVALENYADKRFVPKVQISDDLNVPFFVVLQRGDVLEPIALSVRDRHGDVFVVPEPRYGDVSRHQTLRVLTVVTDLVSASISAKGLPLATSVIVRGVD